MHRNKTKLPAPAPIPNDNPDHYRMKSVENKHNVFNRKLARKAKRHGVKDVEKYVEDNKKSNKKNQNSRAKGFQDKKALKDKQKNQKVVRHGDSEPDLKDVYNDEANKEYLQRMIEEDDKEIARYEKLLGIKSKKDKEKRMFKDMMDDDSEDEGLFDFLDGISKKVHSNEMEDYSQKKSQLEEKSKLKKKQEEQKKQEEDGDEEDYSGNDDGESGEEGEEDEEGEYDEEEVEGEEFGEGEEGEEEIEDDMEGMEGMEDVEEGEGEYEEGDEAEEEGEELQVGQEEEEKIEGLVKKNSRFDREEILKHLDPQKKLELERVLRGGINRLAEGNIESIFKQLVELYNKNSQYVISELYSEIFIKSCVEQRHLQPMIFASNACLLAALFNLLEDSFLADFIRKLIISFRENFAESLKEADTVNDEDGERPVVYKTRNTLLIFCFLYDFDILNEDFIQEVLLYLADHLNNDTISHISSIIQNAGYKIRQNNPGSIKLILDYLRGKYEEKKQSQGEKERLSKKMDFIFLNINDLKHNKKLSNDAQDRLTVLLNWLKKQVISRSGKASKKFPTRFGDMINNQFSHPRWWMPVQILAQSKDDDKDFRKEILGSMQSDQMDKLEKLAIEQRFTSDLRKRIFMVIMSAEDYIDASQKLLKMKLNKKQAQELAVVIVESCAQEDNFNKYYGYLAENLIKLRSSLKYSFQFALWDHFKQLENYGLRKIANLAKFMSFLVLRKEMGIQSLRGLEFEALNTHQELLLKVFFKDLFKLIDEDKLNMLFRGISENESFAMFREGLRGYLQEKLMKTIKKNTDNVEEKEMREKIKRASQMIKGGFDF